MKIYTNCLQSQFIRGTYNMDDSNPSRPIMGELHHTLSGSYQTPIPTPQKITTPPYPRSDVGRQSGIAIGVIIILVVGFTARHIRNYLRNKQQQPCVERQAPRDSQLIIGETSLLYDRSRRCIDTNENLISDQQWPPRLSDKRKNSATTSAAYSDVRRKNGNKIRHRYLWPNMSSYSSESHNKASSPQALRSNSINSSSPPDSWPSHTKSSLNVTKPRYNEPWWMEVAHNNSTRTVERRVSTPAPITNPVLSIDDYVIRRVSADFESSHTSRNKIWVTTDDDTQNTSRPLVTAQRQATDQLGVQRQEWTT